MRFFNKIEKNYLNYFLNQHRNFRKTYFTPFYEDSDEFPQEVAYKSSYFFMRGIVALFDAGVSLLKGIFALFSFSFKDTKLAALNTGCYLSSWILKHSFCIISTCLDVVQFLSRSFSLFYVSFLQAA